MFFPISFSPPSGTMRSVFAAAFGAFLPEEDLPPLPSAEAAALDLPLVPPLEALAEFWGVAAFDAAVRPVPRLEEAGAFCAPPRLRDELCGAAASG
ncbi:MAG: hypothetical protein LBD12_01695 [Clostridiales Family XIII bacterium]|jgi:hypothetical protein|nr:hypothetical protein [Clostridiales Family XIII bacterium]